MTTDTTPRRETDLLTQDQIHALHQSLIAANIEPRSLLVELDPQVRAILEETATTQADSLLAILSRANRLRLIDGSVPFRTLLKTALILVGPDKTQFVLRQALKNLEPLSSASSALGSTDHKSSKSGGLDQIDTPRRHSSLRVLFTFSVAGAAVGLTIEATSGVLLVLALCAILLLSIILGYGFKAILVQLKNPLRSKGVITTATLSGTTPTGLGGAVPSAATATTWKLTATTVLLCASSGIAAVGAHRAFIVAKPHLVSSQLQTCPSDRQEYQGVCVSAKMVAFVTCVKSSGSAIALAETDSVIFAAYNSDAQRGQELGRRLAALPAEDRQRIMNSCFSSARSAGVNFM